METFKFHNDAPMLNYYKKSLNICCFSSLSSAFVGIQQIKAYNDISLRIAKFLKSKMGNRGYFSNAILKKEKNSGQTKSVLWPEKNKKKGSYNILTVISEHVTLVQLMDYLRNVNYAISVVGYWIFDSNYKRTLVLNR